jgi:NitT/TauT family transport system permease protein
MPANTKTLAARHEGTPPRTTPADSPARAPRVRWFDLRHDIPAPAYRALTVAGFASLVGLWAWLSHREFVDSVFLPTPEAVWEAARAVVADGDLWIDVKASFIRVTAGFLLAAAIAIPVGIAIGAFKVFEGLWQPLIEFVRYIPVPALVPICMVLFGIDELSKVALIWAGTFFQLALMVADEIRRVPRELLDVSYTLGAGRRLAIQRVMWRAAKPGIFDALRLCNGWAWTYLVIAELVAANEGLGYRVLKFSRFLQTPRIWVYLLILGVIGLALDFTFRAVNRRLFRWADTTAAA